jgi:outer membrane receptor protein involved in Fe transport
MMMCVGCVWAQGSGPNAAADASPDPAATPPLSETIQTVLVSTRRRVESSQNVPTPMTVLNGDELAANRTQDDGYIRNRYNGSRVQGGLRQGVRAQALYGPSKDFSLRVIADYNEEDSNNGTLIFYNAGPSGKFLAQAAPVGAHPVTNPEDRAVNLDSGSHVNVHQGGVSAEANCSNGERAWNLQLWARNLFDRQYYTSMWNGSFGSYNAVIGTPRTIGATARLDF